MDNQSWDLAGYKGKQDYIRELKISPELEVIENIYNDRDYIVELKSSELSTICPKTGLPDFAEITIIYIPNEYLVEEKSLKLYLSGYRNIGIFQENATNKIFDDFIKKVKPKYLKIIANWNPRGGIGVKVEIESGKLNVSN